MLLWVGEDRVILAECYLCGGYLVWGLPAEFFLAVGGYYYFITYAYSSGY